MDRSVSPQSATQDGDQLQTKYYCQVEKKNMKVVMEMQPTTKQRTDRLPLRYVLLIDVSDSMNTQVGFKQQTLLDRVQAFAELAVRKVSQNDWLSIVTFSDEARIEMKMLRMFRDNKLLARNIIQTLRTRNRTNLEKGMKEALEAVRSAQRMYRASRDCIILFTDGVANEGETNAMNLINCYKKLQKSMNLKSCIPVSAFTIGGYRPDLLIELSRHLGSESFYWLNDEDDFEADMLIPLFLREVTNVSDVDIRIDARANCYFDPIDRKAAHLTDIQVTKVKLKQQKNEKRAFTNLFAKKMKKIPVPTTQRYFIHSLPDDQSKNLTFNVELSELQDLSGQRVVDITIHYLDCDLIPRTIQDFIVYDTTKMPVSPKQDPTAMQLSISHEHRLMELYIYTVSGNHTNSSWSEAQDAVIKIVEEKCKHISVNSIANVRGLTGEDPLEIDDVYQQACLDMKEMRSHVQSILYQSEESIAKAEWLIDQWSKTIFQAIEIARKKDDRNFAKLASMESSISTENPTGGGIFEGEQPFMNDAIKAKLEEEKLNLEAIRRLRAGGSLDVETAKTYAIKAIKEGILTKMESFFLDLKAWRLVEANVENEFIEYVEKEIDHRRRLEELKKDLDVSLRNGDFPNVNKIISELRDLRNNPDLTFIQADAHSLDQGTEAFAQYQLKQSLRGEIAQQMSLLDLKMVPENMDTIASAIKSLLRLKMKSEKLADVFTEKNDTKLNVAIATHREVTLQIESFTAKMNELVKILHFPRRPSNFQAIGQAVSEMENVKKQIEGTLDGLFTEKQENALRIGIEGRDELKAEKGKLQNSLKEVLPTLELPMMPQNYIPLKEAVDETFRLKQRSAGFKGVYLDEHEALVIQASVKVGVLLGKKSDLEDKIASNLLNAKLPKLSSNFEKIKAAVGVLLASKQEANGFENVFTKEHQEVLENGLISVKILGEQKNEVMKEESECVPQLRLPMIPDNLNQITEGINTMKQISPDMKGFGLYKEEYDSLYNQAVFNRDVLNEKKQQILSDIQTIKPNLKVTLTPENLPTLRVAVDKMMTLKSEAKGFDNVFSRENETELFEATVRLQQLNKNVHKMNVARQTLHDAVEKRNFTELKHAVKRASHTSFIEEDELVEPRKLVAFLDPKKRCAAVKNAMEEEDIELIEEALLDMGEAGVVNETLEHEANVALNKLRKQRRKEERARRRLAKEKRRRKRALRRLETCLREAIESRDLETVEQAICELDVSEFQDEEVRSAKEVRDLLPQLKIERTRENLKYGIRTRQVDALYSALMDATYGGYEEFMEEEYTEAETLLIYLLEMMRLREEITKMTRASISEVHSYSTPPKTIIKIMRAFFTILGENPRELTWIKLQALMGKLGRNSMTKRVGRFRIEDVSETASAKARVYLEGLDIDDVETVSKQAAALYAWAKYVVKEAGHIQEMREKQKNVNEESPEQYDQDEFELDGEKASLNDASDSHTKAEENLRNSSEPIEEIDNAK